MPCKLCLHRTPRIWPLLSISTVTNLVYAHLWSEVPSSCPCNRAPSTFPALFNLISVIQLPCSSSSMLGKLPTQDLDFDFTWNTFLPGACLAPWSPPFPHISTPKSHVLRPSLATQTDKTTLRTDASQLSLWFFFSLSPYHYLIYYIYYFTTFLRVSPPARKHHHFYVLFSAVFPVPCTGWQSIHDYQRNGRNDKSL